MALRASVLFRHDRRGRIRWLNEPPYDPAPRVWVGLAREGPVVRWREEADRARAERFAAMLGEDESDLTELVRAHLRDLPLARLWVGPAFVFAPVPPVRHAPVVRVHRVQVPALLPHFPWIAAQWHVHGPVFAAVVDGRAVAVCMSARQSLAGAEASLHTMAPYRGRGLGRMLAQAWAHALQAEGRVAFYSTSAHNIASQAVARSLGLVPVGVDVHLS